MSNRHPPLFGHVHFVDIRKFIPTDIKGKSGFIHFQQDYWKKINEFILPCFDFFNFNFNFSVFKMAIKLN